MPATYTSLVIIDSRVPEYQKLLADVPEDTAIITLQPEQGKSYLEAELANYSDLDSIHIISHGADKHFQLGTFEVHDTNFDYEVHFLRSILGATLKPDGDILLYGSNLATTPESRYFIDIFALLTEADVAVSDDRTGKGGDWELEYRTGTVESTPVITPTTAPGYRHSLDMIDFTGVDFSDFGSTSTVSFSGYDVDLTVTARAPVGLGTMDGNGISISTAPFAIAENDLEMTFTFSEVVNVLSLGIAHDHTDAVTLTIDSNLKNNAFTTPAIPEDTESPLVYYGQAFSAGELDGITSFTVHLDYEYVWFGIDNIVFETPNKTPDFLSSNSFSVDETASSTSAVLLDVNADDGDEGAADTDITYSITGGSGQSLFTIDSDDGEIRLNTSGVSTLDKETAGSYTLTVQADDGQEESNTETQTITVTVNDIAPEITSGQVFSVNESDNNSASIGTVLNTGDADSVTWSIESGNTDAAFEINSSSGEITLRDTSVLDASVTPDYTLTVRADDGNNGAPYSEETVTINVNDDIVPTVSSIAPSGTPAANAASIDFTVTFSESVNNVSVDDFSLTPTGSAVGNIANVTGSGSSYTVTVNNITGQGSLRLDLKNASNITDGSNSLAAYGSGSSHTVDRIAPVVSDVAVPAADTYIANETLDFTVNFDDNITLTGTSSTLGLTVGSQSANALYHDKTANSITYRYTVQANDLDTDGISVNSIALNSDTLRDASGNDAILTLNNIGDLTSVLIDAVPPGTPAGSLSIDENAASNSAVGTLTASDATAFELTDDAGGRFAIDNSGHVTLANGSQLDHEDNASHNITVQATDSAGNTSSQTLSVTVNDINEIPNGNDKQLITEKNTPLTLTLADLGFSDPDSDSVSHITINSTPGAGTLWLDTDGNNAVSGAEVALNTDETVTATQLSNGQLKFRPENDTSGTDYATIDFTVNDGALDAASSSRWTIDVIAAPIIDLNSAAPELNRTGISYTENDQDTPVELLGSTIPITINDDDSALVSLNISITSNAQPDDYLEITGQDDGDTLHNVTVTYDSPTEITLTSAGSGSDFVTVLQALIFAQTGDAVGGPDRVISITGTNANGITGLASTITLAVEGTNDEPVASHLTQTITLNEDDGLTYLSNEPEDFAVSDADGETEQLTATLTLSDPTAGTLESLDFYDNPLGSFDSQTGVWSITGTPDEVDLGLYLASFTPAEHYDQNLTVAISVSDGGENGSSAQTGTVTVNITPVNDAPTLMATGTNPTFNSGRPAVNLFNNALIDTFEPDQPLAQLTLTVTEISDTDDENLVIDGHALGISNTATGVALGDYSADVNLSGTTATIILDLSSGANSIADIQTLIDGLQYRNDASTLTIANRTVTLTALRDGGGTENDGDDTVNGLSLTSVVTTSNNRTPTGADKTLSLSEDGRYTLKTSDFGFSDTDASDTLHQVRI
ncbi:MAG: DUF4347 domain-containing protein, partial [Marinobacterium sp.]|nr:DUF4347 domain-containing protein [Marinobacterium sp.]